MGNLFDELKKAKLIDKKRAKQLAHEQRVEKKTQGGQLAADAALEQKAAEHESRKADEKRRNREREAQPASQAEGSRAPGRAQAARRVTAPS